MNIRLGTFLFGDDDNYVTASIEPVKPAFRESIGRVVDGGRLRVQTIDAEPEGPAFDLLLENTSEDRWKLTAAVGADLARHLAEEHDRYARQPFFMAFEHEQFGRLYFEPVSPAQQQEGIAFSLSTRPADPKTAQSLTIGSQEDLEAFLIANRLNGGVRWMPNQPELAAAVHQGKDDALAVANAQREYAAGVIWDFDARMEEAAEFESANLAAVRPDIYSFQEDSTEFYRWYEYGGKPRPEPLTREALADLLNETPNAGGMSQAFTAEQWDRFKDWKLGDLRSPIETLQGIVQKHGAEGPWWESARKAADWCRTAKRPHPVEVHDALDGLIFRAQRDAEVNGAELPAWHQQATDARNAIEAAYTREIEASSSSTSLADAYGRLHELHASHRKALLEGDAEQAAFERHEASQIERLFPVLKELVQFGAEDALEVEATDESPAP